MKKKQLSARENKELDTYLGKKFNYEIFQELTGDDSDNKDVFEPLEFFRLFYKQVAFLTENKDKPLFVIQNLEKLRLNNYQLRMLCDVLNDYLMKPKQKIEQFDVCSNEIYKLRNRIEFEDDEIYEIPSRHQKTEDKFGEIIKHLGTLPDEPTRIKHLKKTKIEYEAEKGKNSIQIELILEDSFYSKLENEIYKRESLLKLEKLNPVQPNAETKKHKDLTLDRATLAMNYLLTFAKANGYNTDKAKFISFLTGYSENTIVQKLSTLHKKEDANYTAYEKDMNVISKYFEKLGLSEIVKMIDNDLEV